MFLKQFFKKKLMDNAMHTWIMDTNYFRSNSFCKETTGLLEKKLIFVCSTIVSGGKKWVLAQLAIQPETKYHLFASWCHLLLCFCQLLSSPCKLRSLRQVGLFLLLLAEALVEHLGTWSPGGMGYSLCLQAQPTIALHFPPESSSAVLARQNFYMVNIIHAGELW